MTCQHFWVSSKDQFQAGVVLYRNGTEVAAQLGPALGSLLLFFFFFFFLQMNQTTWSVMMCLFLPNTLNCITAVGHTTTLVSEQDKHMFANMTNSCSPMKTSLKGRSSEPAKYLMHMLSLSASPTCPASFCPLFKHGDFTSCPLEASS